MFFINLKIGGIKRETKQTICYYDRSFFYDYFPNTDCHRAPFPYSENGDQA